VIKPNYLGWEIWLNVILSCISKHIHTYLWRVVISLIFIFVFCLQFIALVVICVAVYAKVSAKITSLPILGGVIACGVFLLLVAIMGVVGAIRHSQVILFFVSFA